MKKEQALKKLEQLDEHMVLLEHIESTLSWDQETIMSDLGVDERAQQIAWIEGEYHKAITSDEMGDVLATLGADDDHPEGVGDYDDITAGLIRLRYNQWRKERVLPSELVSALALATSKGHDSWAKARKASDYEAFKPFLGEILNLVREEAELYQTVLKKDTLYDALLDLYEPGVTAKEVGTLFSRMKDDLKRIIAHVQETPQPDDSFLYKTYPIECQDSFAKNILTAMGFDYSRGVRSISTHPFTTTVGRDDIRITTRYTEPSVVNPLFSTIHEGGHALYELGASSGRIKGTSLAGGASYAFHESQSRLWENIIARGESFWKKYYPEFVAYFPEQTAGVSFDQFIKAVNKIDTQSSRVNADEVSYGLHIIMRFELEQQLVSGSLSLDDLPEAWNVASKDLLGIWPESDAEGVLQDVHWSGGSFGYFPTYALGNLYGAQIWDTLNTEMGKNTVEELISQGNFAPLTSWLNERVYQHGLVYKPKDLLKKITGKDLDSGYFTAYLEEKYRNLYGF